LGIALIALQQELTSEPAGVCRRLLPLRGCRDAKYQQILLGVNTVAQPRRFDSSFRQRRTRVLPRPLPVTSTLFADFGSSSRKTARPECAIYSNAKDLACGSDPGPVREISLGIRPFSLMRIPWHSACPQASRHGTFRFRRWPSSATDLFPVRCPKDRKHAAWRREPDPRL
jgi:hypothetical protein